MPNLAAVTRTVLCAITLAVTVAPVAVAQTGAVATPAPLATSSLPGTTPEIEGTWEGEFFFERGQGPMTLTIEKGDSGRTGKVSVTSPQSTMNAALRNIVVGDGTLVYEALLDGADVTFTARLDAGELIGTFTAVQDGNTVAEGQWSARRKP
jgi:hypothetical protein